MHGTAAEDQTVATGLGLLRHDSVLLLPIDRGLMPAEPFLALFDLQDELLAPLLQLITLLLLQGPLDVAVEGSAANTSARHQIP